VGLRLYLFKLPDQPDPALTAFMTDWVAGQEHHPRADLGE